MISEAAPYLAGYRKAFDLEARRLNLNVIAPVLRISKKEAASVFGDW